MEFDFEFPVSACAEKAGKMPTEGETPEGKVKSELLRYQSFHQLQAVTYDRHAILKPFSRMRRRWPQDASVAEVFLMEAP
jgi:hypothetical protein